MDFQQFLYQVFSLEELKDLLIWTCSNIRQSPANFLNNKPFRNIQHNQSIIKEIILQYYVCLGCISSCESAHDPDRRHRYGKVFAKQVFAHNYRHNTSLCHSLDPDLWSIAQCGQSPQTIWKYIFTLNEISFQSLCNNWNHMLHTVIFCCRASSR